MLQWLKALIAKIRSWFKKDPPSGPPPTVQDGPGPWKPT